MNSVAFFKFIILFNVKTNIVREKKMYQLRRKYFKTFVTLSNLSLLHIFLFKKKLFKIFIAFLLFENEIHKSDTCIFANKIFPKEGDHIKTL